MPQRIIAVGDIHGCAAALEAILDAVAPGSQDILVPIGDFIDRGPNSRAVIERLIVLSSQTTLRPILGNHEEMILAARSSTVELRAWVAFGGAKTLDSYGFGGLELIPGEHWSFLEQCLPYVELEQALFFHANYLPDEPPERQPPRTLRWESLHERLPGPHYSGRLAVVGHTVQVSGEVLDLGYLKAIDTACVMGGWLTAIDVESGQIWQADRHGRLRRR